MGGFFRSDIMMRYEHVLLVVIIPLPLLSYANRCGLPNHFQGTGCRAPPVKVAAMYQASLDNASANMGISDETIHGLGDCVTVIRIEVGRGISCNFRHRGPIGTRHWHPTTHGFQDGEAKSFIQRRKYEQLRSTVEPGQVRSRDKPSANNIVGVPTCLDRTMHLVSARPITTGEYELMG